MDIVSIFENKVSVHKFQKIIPNNYEQGHEYKVLKENQSRNSFIKVPKNITMKKNNTLQLQSLNSVFEKIALIYENGVVLDFDKYKNLFYNSLSNDVFKSISKRHQLLKKEMYTFVFDREIQLPSNKEIFKLLSNVLSINLVFCINDKEYLFYKTENVNKTILICMKNISIEEKKYDLFENCIYDLNYKGLKEYRNYKELKLPELKEYAQFYNIDIKSIKKKADIIELIEKEIKN